MDLYIDTKVNSPNTKISYTHDLNSMADFINKPIEEINEFDILEWKKSLEDFYTLCFFHKASPSPEWN